MCRVPRGSDRLLTFINSAHTHTQSSHLYTGPRLCSISPSLLTPPPLPLSCSFILRGALVFCMMSSWGASAFGRRLCLSYEMKKEQKKRERVGGREGEEREAGWRGKKKEKEEGENLRPPGALHLHIVRICLTASQEGFTSSPGTRRGIITDQNKLPICSQQRCLPVKKRSPELRKI